MFCKDQIHTFLMTELLLSVFMPEVDSLYQEKLPA